MPAKKPDFTSVYKITSPSGKEYIGITGWLPQRRWRQHLAALARGERQRAAKAAALQPQ